MVAHGKIQLMWLSRSGNPADRSVLSPKMRFSSGLQRFYYVFNASQVVQLLDGPPSTRVTFLGGRFGCSLKAIFFSTKEIR